jgi:hypothetical protein
LLGQAACDVSTAMEASKIQISTASVTVTLLFCQLENDAVTGWKVCTSVVMYDADMEELKCGSRFLLEFDPTSMALAFCYGKSFRGIDLIFSLKSAFVELSYSTLHVISQARHHKLIYSNFKTLCCALLAMDAENDRAIINESRDRYRRKDLMY